MMRLGVNQMYWKGVRRQVSRLINGVKKLARDGADMVQNLGVFPPAQREYVPVYARNGDQRRRQARSPRIR